MHKNLILQAFKKAELSRKERGEKKPSAVNIAEDISDYIEKSKKFQLGERSFRDYRNEAEKLLYNKEDINIKQLKVVNGLCNYLGYNFVFKNNYNSNKNKLSIFFKKNKVTLIISSIAIVFIISYTSINQQKWMVWDGNNYIEVKFDTEKYTIGQLKIHNEERIKYFKKITPDCSTEFFDSHGNPKIWYGKNNKKELEYFTDLGLHPETGKTLDPITTYMIKKHICKE
jgi:hypothetical protein